MTDEQFRDLFTALERYVGKRADATDAKIAGLEAKVDRKIAELEARIADLETKVTALDIKIEKVETSLLTEFHKWASPAEARARTISAALRAIDLEMESLDDRVKRLENPRQ